MIFTVVTSRTKEKGKLPIWKIIVADNAAVQHVSFENVSLDACAILAAKAISDRVKEDQASQTNHN